MWLSAKTDRKLSIYNMQVRTTATKQLKCYSLEISEINTVKFIKWLSMFSNQEDFTTSNQDKIISPKQLDNFYRKRDESFYNKKSLTAAANRNSLHWQKLPANVVSEDWTELFFSPSIQGTRSQMWVEFVVGSLPCSERFFSGYPGFSLPSKTNISKFQFDLDYCPALYHIMSFWLGWLRKHSLCLTLNLHLHLQA